MLKHLNAVNTREKHFVVRINHTEYFVFLADKIPGSEDVLAYHHIKFIEYCMGYLRLGHENKWLCT